MQFLPTDPVYLDWEKCIENKVFLDQKFDSFGWGELLHKILIKHKIQVSTLDSIDICLFPSQHGLKDFPS